jgi:uncharacterized protein YqgC (DUF456 family)
MAQHELIGIFSTQTEAENAVLELQKADLNINKISIFGKDFQTRDFFSWKDPAKEGATEFGYWGTVLGALLGTLTGTEFLLIPPITQIIIAGPMFGLFLGAVQGLTVGVVVGALVGALTGVLFEELENPTYENAIKAGKFALMMRGTSQEQEKAREVLMDAGYNIHQTLTV